MQRADYLAFWERALTQTEIADLRIASGTTSTSSTHATTTSTSSTRVLLPSTVHTRVARLYGSVCFRFVGVTPRAARDDEFLVHIHRHVHHE